MPIRASERDRYPKDWRDISARIRQRSGGRCECEGECGTGHAPHRCTARHGEPNPLTGSRVVLTTMHLDRVPEHCADDNLKAACQRCHLNYDRHQHAINASRTRSHKRGQGTLDLGETP